jgi:hypothetical protein
MRRLLSIAVILAALVITDGARADADSASHYYLSLGDSLAAGSNATGPERRSPNSATPTNCTPRSRRTIRNSST